MSFNSGKNRVEFKSSGTTVVGDLYCPDDFDRSQVHPAIVVGGPLSTVKEQAAGVFARALANRGYIALAFDYRTFGESGGEPRYYENPAAKSEDIRAAICFLASLRDVDSERLAALGICASSSYVSSALVGESRVKSFATVSAYFSLNMFLTGDPSVSEEDRAKLLRASNAASQKYFETGIADRSGLIWPKLTGQEEDIDSREIYDYYYARVEACWPNFSRDLVDFSYEQLFRSNALDCAKSLTLPYLGVVGSDAFTRPITEMFLDGKVQGEKGLHVMEGATHIAAYDKPEYVDEAVNVIDAFYGKHL
jgi:pimeloyl-ACP methyl ester carboxylesterase